MKRRYKKLCCLFCVQREDSSGGIIDLDDEEVPLANAELDEDDRAGIPMVGMIAMLIIALVALANVVFYIAKNKKR